MGTACCRTVRSPSLLQLVCQDHFVGRFQQALSEAGMNAVGRVHDLLRHVVFGHGKSKDNLSQSRQARQENLACLREPGDNCIWLRSSKELETSSVIGPPSGSWSRKTGVNRSRNEHTTVAEVLREHVTLEVEG